LRTEEATWGRGEQEAIRAYVVDVDARAQAWKAGLEECAARFEERVHQQARGEAVRFAAEWRQATAFVQQLETQVSGLANLNESLAPLQGRACGGIAVCDLLPARRFRS
jgi:hypothetical protein